MGKRGSEADFRSGLDEALAAGAEVVAAPRGGETTYHGPGQLVAYPLLSLRGLRLGVRAYVEALEDAMIEAAAGYGVAARGRLSGRTGVWVGERKLGAVGVAISGGYTRHGMALNVATDLEAFGRIVACGDPLREATSLEAEAGRRVELGGAAEVLAEAAAWRLGFAGVEWIPEVGQLGSGSGSPAAAS